jgi:hydantoinase/carbamoylase family amidase
MHPRTRDYAVNAERIREELRAFARIGYRADGGMHRLAFSRADRQARQRFVYRLRQLGLAVDVDAFGNVFGWLTDQAADPTLPPVLLGSHLDTVPGGGRFDGTAGVVAALEVVTVVREHGLRLTRPLGVVAFSCEESSRFGRGTLGSALVAGTVTPDEILDLRDSQGTTLRQILARSGLYPELLATVRRPPGAFAAYLELHIEQGRVLESTGAVIGIVEAIAAPTRLWVTVVGQADHAGATPMPLRRDALTGAAEIILAVERLALSHPGSVGTVGVVRVEPGAINVIPGRVELGIDLRSADAGTKAALVTAVQQALAVIARERELDVACATLTDETPVPLDPAIIALLEQCAAARQLPYRRMISGAGHDAMQIAQICPAGMILVPSRAGISHNPHEWTAPDDIAQGTQVLLDAALVLATSG